MKYEEQCDNYKTTYASTENHAIQFWYFIFQFYSVNVLYLENVYSVLQTTST